MERSIRLRGLTKEFSTGSATTIAVAGIDLDITPGEVVALLGPNGAGKTTTLDTVLGFTEPTDGTVEVLGTSPRRAVADGRLSAVLQTGGLLRDLTVGETVELIASTYPGSAPADVIQRTGLEPIIGRRVQLCSGGEQQRLRFALALLADPELLVLDEPTAGLDVEARRAFWASMSHEAERGRTIVFATHYLQEAEDYAGRTVVLANGLIVADGSTEQIRRRASGSTVTARIEPDRTQATLAALRRHDFVLDASATEGRLTVETSNSDAVARLLLGELNGRDLAINPASLETAFVRLTGGHGLVPDASLTTA